MIPPIEKHTFAYKNLPDGSPLVVDVYSLADPKPAERRPAAVFFHGGGWHAGTRDQFAPQAGRLAELGMVCLTPAYRTRTSHGTPPQAALADAKSALRWIRTNADRLLIDPGRLAACGGSAGAHMAAAACMCPGFDGQRDDRSVPIDPAAMVLWNPVIDNGPDGYGHAQIKADFPAFSPAHNVRPGLPVSLIHLGTEDDLVPVATGRAFEAAMRAAGNECRLVLYEGGVHGFFNYRAAGNPFYDQTLLETIAFFRRLGWISA
jgi:acetyl esterase/lipase